MYLVCDLHLVVLVEKSTKHQLDAEAAIPGVNSTSSGGYDSSTLHITPRSHGPQTRSAAAQGAQAALQSHHRRSKHSLQLDSRRQTSQTRPRRR